MPFGLRNAAQTFQRFIGDVCRNLDFVFIYLDDILIASSSLDEHLAMLFQRLSDHGLVIKPAKYEFGKSEVNFLSHTIRAASIRPHITRVEAVCRFPVFHYTSVPNGIHDRHPPYQGSANHDADSLSCNILALEQSLINLDALASAQDQDEELLKLSISPTSLELAQVPLLHSQRTLLCDISQGYPCPLVQCVKPSSTNCTLCLILASRPLIV